MRYCGLDPQSSEQTQGWIPHQVRYDAKKLRHCGLDPQSSEQTRDWIAHRVRYDATKQGRKFLPCLHHITAILRDVIFHKLG
jgi:hypothetical protein